MVLSREIKRRDKLIAEVEMAVTREYVQRALVRLLYVRAGTVLVVAILLAVALQWAIHRFIMRPVSRVVDTLAESAGDVLSASRQISDSSQSLASAASEQSSSLEETAASAAEAAANTKRNAEHAKQADATMHESARKFAELSEGMARMSEAIAQIKKETTQTATIIKTIDEIAFQTNLLALNAAVEAARAGEAGKGFAVVAEEVRNLARRSAEAARNTTDLLDSSRKSADTSVSISERVVQSVKALEGDSAKVAGLISEIATAAREQAQGIEQINQALGEMEHTVQQNAASAEESASAAEDLSARADAVNMVVDSLSEIVGRKATSSQAPSTSATTKAKDVISLDVV